MSIFKEAWVVMVPTTKEVTQVLKTKNGLDYNPFLKTRKSDSYQHLYFLLDDEIKKGDWVVAFIDNEKVLRQVDRLSKDTHIITTEYSSIHIEDCKKIIATTDESITELIYPGAPIPDSLYPQPPQQFIKEYCKKGGIEKVMVEFVTEEKESYNKYGMYHKHILKVSSDNTISIKPLNDSYSREELNELLLNFAKDCFEDAKDSVIWSETYYQHFTRKWTKEKL